MKQGWTAVPNEIIERAGELGHATVAVYLTIAMHTRETGEAWPSVRAIVDITRCSPRTVLRAIETLEKAGFMTVSRGVLDNGSKAANHYLIPRPGSDTRETPPPVRVVTPGKQGSDTRETPLFPSCHEGVSPAETEEDLKKKERSLVRTRNHTEADIETARWMFDLILAMQPGRRPPKFEAWANCVRLMREQDRRTDGEIRDLFQRANADPFWQTNILSPEKLRAKWDDLQLKLRRANGAPKAAALPKPFIDRPGVAPDVR